MAQLYQVVFTGRLRSGTNPEQAARDFAAVFKVPEDKAWKLVLGETEHILKRDVDEPNATRYHDILEEIGLEVRVEAAGTPLPGGAAQPAEVGPGGQAAAPPPAAPSPSAGGGAGRARDVERNPYAPPSADLTPPASAAGGGSMSGPHQVPAGHGWQWITRAWTQFKAQPWGWVGGVLIVYGLNMLLSLVPMLGGLASIVLGPVFLGGLMLGARAQEQAGGFRSGAAFDGFSRNGGQLALVGVLYFVAIFAVIIVAGGLVMGAGLLSAGAMEALSSNDPELVATAIGPGLVLLLLVVMLLIVPVIMAYWFAPALVAIDGLPAVQAMTLSFRACLMNILPFLVYGLALFGVMLGVGILFGLVGAVFGSLAGPLGAVVFILLIPVMVTIGTVVVVSIYTGYRDVFYHALGTGARGSWAAH